MPSTPRVQAEILALLQRLQARARHRHPVHHPRSRRRGPAGAGRRGDVDQGQAVEAGQRRGRDVPPDPPVYPRAGLRPPDAWRRRRRARSPASRRPGPERREGQLHLSGPSLVRPRASAPSTRCRCRLPPGRTLGILGESGSGKSTLASLVAGLARPDAGDIRLFGQSLGAAQRFRMTRERAPALPDHLPEPLWSAQSAADDGEGGCASRSSCWEAAQLSRSAAAPAAGADRGVGLEADHLDRYPAPALGRPAPARLHRPGPAVEAGPADLRRDRLGTRRHRADAGARTS